MLFFILGYYLPFYLPNSQKKSKFRESKTPPQRYHHFTIVYQKIMIICFTVLETWCAMYVTIFHFWPLFALLSPQQSKIQNFEKMKKTLGDIIFLHKIIENYDQMMCGSWDMVCNKYNCYFSFWTIFYPFNPVTTKKKIKILKKWKKSMGISSFYISVLKTMTRWCMVPEICCATEGRMNRRREKVTYRGGYPT